MRETPGPGAGDALLRQALLYAGGDLEGPAVEAFENLLESDQAARDALCSAVELARALGGGPPAGPDRAYRAAVRRRLRPAAWRRLLGRHSYRGHPLLWGGLGAAAALLLVAAVAAVDRHPGESAPRAVPAADAAPDPEPALAEAPHPSPADVADVWAELHNHQHLAKAHADEMRRKSRADSRSLQDEERRIRPPGHPMGKHP
jgi:hypothetical protein